MMQILLAVMLWTGIAHPGDDNLIQWNSARRLTWNDFRGVPPEQAYNAALTCSGITMRFTYNGELKYTISCNFEKERSWGRVKNDHILAHEQGHFDIAELHARRLNQAIRQYQVQEKTISKDMNAMYKKAMDDLQQMQQQYDGETDHSRNTVQQRLWLGKIEKMLNALPAYLNETAQD